MALNRNGLFSQQLGHAILGRLFNKMCHRLLETADGNIMSLILLLGYAGRVNGESLRLEENTKSQNTGLYYYLAVAGLVLLCVAACVKYSSSRSQKNAEEQQRLINFSAGAFESSPVPEFEFASYRK